jgi:hypothetical protein
MTFGPGQPGAPSSISELADKIPLPMVIRLLPQLQHLKAKEDALTWVAEQMVRSHDHAARRMSEALTGTGEIVDVPRICLCSLCRHARPWVQP